MELTCDRGCWYEDSDGFWFAARTKDRAAAAQISQEMDGKPWTIEAKPQRKKRSLDANAYMWVLLDKLSSVLHRPKIELYRELIRGIGGNNETVCVLDDAVDKLRSGWEHNGIGWVTETIPSKIAGCTNVILYYGSSTYDTAQMSRLVSLVVDECKEQSIEIITPAELSGMMEAWNG